MTEFPSVPPADVFRFATIRPARRLRPQVIDIGFVSFDFFTQIATPDLAAIEATEQLLYTQLMAEMSDPNPRAAMESEVNDFRTGSAHYIADSETLYEKFPRFNLIHEMLQKNKHLTDMADLKDKIESILDGNISTYLGDSHYLENKLRLWDNLFSLMVLPTDDALRELIIDAIKILRIMERIHAGDGTLTETGIKDAIEANVILPKPLFPLKKIVNTVPEAPEPEPDSQVEIEEAITAIKNLQKARLDIEHVFSAQVLKSRIKNFDRSSMEDHGTGREPNIPKDVTDFPNDKPVDPMFLTNESAEALQSNTKDLLDELKVPKEYLHVPFLYEKIDEALKRKSEKAYSDSAREYTVVQVGGALFSSRNLCIDEPVSTPCDPYTGVSLPKGSGHIKPSGIADLLVVQQQLLKYELGEIAHIENVMLTEEKERTHRNLNREEETFTIESESSKEQERDTQTTERFGVEKESSSVVQEDQSLEAGVTISASYGGMVSISAGVNYATSSSSINSSSMATQYAKSVTDRAVERVKERVRTVRTKTTIAETEETNLHGFNNIAGADHVIGQYHWVDKYYLNKVMNYGKRLMFEFTIPEPAAFYIFAKAAKPAEGNSMTMPVSPEELKLKSHTDITPSNYGIFLSAYNVQGITAPPRQFQTVSLAFNNPNTGHNTWGTYSSKDLKVPTGYLAKMAYAKVGSDWGQAFIMLQVGRQSLGGKYGYFYSAPLDNETDYVPVSAFMNFNTLAYVNIEVLVERSPELLEEWQLKTYSAIMDAYYAKKREYDEKVAGAAVSAGIMIEGNNPLRNREIERTELKKGCIELLTDQKFDAFDAMRNNQPSQGYPEFRNIEAKAEGDYIRFFEQAFEWSQMTYVFYPYFWGRKKNWTAISLLEDNDPLFTNFLQAGAVRVVVPVRPGFTEAMLYYTESGNIWNGASVPTINDPLYLSIINEIKTATGTLEIEPVEVGDPWITKVPTSLVKLAPGINPAFPDNSTELGVS